jgi:hypothetical protein
MEDLNEMQPQSVNTEETVTNASTAATTTVSNPSATEHDNPVSEPSEPTVTMDTPTEEIPSSTNTPTETPDTETAAAEKEAPEPTIDYSSHSREELVEDLKALLQEDISAIRDRAALIRNTFANATKELQKAAFDAFIAEGGNKDEYQPADDAVADTFYKLYTTYRERRQKHLEAIEAQKQQNLEAKKKIIEELRTLVDNESSLKKAYDDFNALQDRWKTIGEIPREAMNDLWQNYHFLVEQFFNKIKINKELKMLDMKKNLEQKIQICEKVEELIVDPSVTKAFKTLQGLREQWKEIGPVPPEQNEEIWTRFCTAADQINDRHRQFFEQRREEMDKNLLAKQALITQATEITTETPTNGKVWLEKCEQLDELLKVWKSIGPVPREQNEDIWNQFKGMIDAFFTKKKAHFDQVKDMQTENYNKKIDLCLKAEAIAKREDWKKATDELLQLQAEWKTIGPVNRKFHEKIWQRFRAACDEFFTKKGEYFSHVKENETDNLAKKKDLIEQIKAFEGTDSKEQNLNALKDFQRQWMEIGFVPAGEKERLRKEYHDAIDAQFEKLKISAREAEEAAYRERINNVVGDTRKFVNNEREELNSRIEKLHNDLKLWENNLGFLSSSKQADLLKNEFEKKMQGTRQQIALLEAKLRILKESENAPNDDNSK